MSSLWSSSVAWSCSALGWILHPRPADTTWRQITALLPQASLGAGLLGIICVELMFSSQPLCLGCYTHVHTHTLHRTQRRWDICPQPIELTHGSTEPTRTIPSSLPLTLSPPFTFIYHLFVQQVLQHTQRSSQLWRAFPNSIFTTETLSISMLSLSLSYHGCCTVVHIRRQGWTGSSETPPVDSHLPCTTVVFSTPSGNTTTRVRSCSRGLSCCSMGVRW